MSKFDIAWETMVAHDIATEDECELVCHINGWNIDSLNDIMYARTGYQDYDQWVEAEDIEEVLE